MNTRLALATATLAGLCGLCALPVRAQTATPPAAAASAPAAAIPPAESTEDRGEPHVQRSVIEDEGSRIEELKVRGQTTRISVASKFGNAKGYEIIPSEVGRGHWNEGAVPASGAAGKSVWHLFSF